LSSPQFFFLWPGVSFFTLWRAWEYLYGESPGRASPFQLCTNFPLNKARFLISKMIFAGRASFFLFDPPSLQTLTFQRYSAPRHSENFSGPGRLLALHFFSWKYLDVGYDFFYFRKLSGFYLPLSLDPPTLLRDLLLPSREALFPGRNRLRGPC